MPFSHKKSSLCWIGGLGALLALPLILNACNNNLNPLNGPISIYKTPDSDPAPKSAQPGSITAPTGANGDSTDKPGVCTYQGSLLAADDNLPPMKVLDDAIENLRKEIARDAATDGGKKWRTYMAKKLYDYAGTIGLVTFGQKKAFSEGILSLTPKTSPQPLPSASPSPQPSPSPAVGPSVASALLQGDVDNIPSLRAYIVHQSTFEFATKVLLLDSTAAREFTQKSFYLRTDAVSARAGYQEAYEFALRGSPPDKPNTGLHYSTTDAKKFADQVVRLKNPADVILSFEEIFKNDLDIYQQSLPDAQKDAAALTCVR